MLPSRRKEAVQKLVTLTCRNLPPAMLCLGMISQRCFWPSCWPVESSGMSQNHEWTRYTARRYSMMRKVHTVDTFGRLTSVETPLPKCECRPLHGSPLYSMLTLNHAKIVRLPLPKTSEDREYIPTQQSHAAIRHSCFYPVSAAPTLRTHASVRSPSWPRPPPTESASWPARRSRAPRGCARRPRALGRG